MKKKAGDRITGLQMELCLYGDYFVPVVKPMSHKEPYGSSLASAHVDSSGVVPDPLPLGNLGESKPQDVVVIGCGFDRKQSSSEKRKKSAATPLTQLFYFLEGKNVRVRCGVCDESHRWHAHRFKLLGMAGPAFQRVVCAAGHLSKVPVGYSREALEEFSE